jgi:four helix bundle protein
LPSSSFGRELLSLLIIEPLVGRALRLTSFRKSALLLEEADETLFWFELLVEAEMVKRNLVEQLMNECKELLKIFSASLATAKRNR